MDSHRWTAADIPDQTDRIHVITGATSGLGLAAARALARKGAYLVLPVRDQTRGEATAARIRAETPGAKLELPLLDLASLASVRAFAVALRSRHSRVDVLVNNAGVMAIPELHTEDGFEMQLGINYLGHFALTGLLLPCIQDRVVAVTSVLHWKGRIRLDDLNFDRGGYSPWRAYGQSKLAVLLFAQELARELLCAGSSVRSVAAHPGYALTNIFAAAVPMNATKTAAWAWGVSRRLLAQTPEMGALPLLYAATAPEVQNGACYGPGGFLQLRGFPRRVRTAPVTQEGLARKLWEASSALTGIPCGMATHDNKES